MELARDLDCNGCLINLCWRSDEWMLMVSGAIFLPSSWPAGLLTDTCSVYFWPSALRSPWGCTRWHRHWSGKACRSIQAPMSPFPTPLPTNHSCLPPFKNMITMNPRGPPFMGPQIFFTTLNMGFISVTTRDTWRERQRVQPPSSTQDHRWWMNGYSTPSPSQSQVLVCSLMLRATVSPDPI